MLSMSKESKGLEEKKQAILDFRTLVGIKPKEKTVKRQTRLDRQIDEFYKWAEEKFEDKNVADLLKPIFTQFNQPPIMHLNFKLEKVKASFNEN